MIINVVYPSKLTWIIDLKKFESASDAFGNGLNKKIRSSYRKFEESDYNFVIESVDEAYIDKFIPLYEENIKKKDGKIYDVKDKIIVNPPHNYPYFALSLYKDEEYLGGLIYSDRGDHYVGAYKIFPSKLEFTAKVGATMLAEYFLYSKAISNQISYIRRGKDRNLYGVNSRIGLALFKYKIGAKPNILPENEKFEIGEQFEWDEEKDVLIFEMPEKGREIKKAKLLIAQSSSDDFQEKYKCLLLQKVFNIEVIHAKA